MQGLERQREGSDFNLGGRRAGVQGVCDEGGQRKREDSDTAEAADLHRGMEPMSRY